MGERMVKTIMVQLTGHASDEAALETGYLIARLFSAHIEAVHVSPSWAEFAASMAAQNLDSAISPVEAIESFEEESKNAATRAREQLASLCKRWNIAEANSPVTPERVTAAWRECKGAVDRVITSAARFYDLTVVSRSPDSAIDALVLNAGKPVVVAPEKAPENLAPTIAIAWKETAEAARAVTAAMPLLERASKVLLIGADEGSGPDAVIESTGKMVETLAWHGIKAEAHCVNPSGRSVAGAILQCALGNKADLLVMGAYGHSRVREFILGGVTRDVLSQCSLPVFLYH
jgi:nucleotide-binding universal stress UspA family protein